MSVSRIAAGQFVSGEDPGANLASLLSLAEEAARIDADLVHFQEFCNHPCWYASRDHAWQAAVTLDGPFVRAIRALAARHSMYISFNATVRGPYPSVLGQNHLVGRDGEILIRNPKQVLMYNEKDCLVPASSPGVVASLDIGAVGLMSCMDGLVPETVRCLVVDGAEIVLNSLSSNGLDEAHTHIPVRAAENGVFVVSANRVGPPVAEEAMPELEAATGMRRERLMGAGESEIVGPNGSVLARASRDGRELIHADVDLRELEREARLETRRPPLYRALTKPPATVSAAGHLGPGRVSVAAVVPGSDDVGGALEALEGSDAQLMVLPELSGLPRPESVEGCDLAARRGKELLDGAAALCRTRACWVVAGVVEREGENFYNSAALVGPDGLLTSYRQVHVRACDPWATAGSEFVTFDLPFGRIGLLIGLDLCLPEGARVLALRGADLIACPTSWTSGWEANLACVERSAENHLTLVCAARADSPIYHPSTILTGSREYLFPTTGEVNMPIRRDAPLRSSGVSASVDLATSRDKRLMGRTDLIADARPDLYATLGR